MGLFFVGGLGVLLVLAVDVLFPAGLGWHRRRWLAAALAIPVPYLVTVLALAVFD